MAGVSLLVEVAGALHAARVDYAVAGGMAVVLHGHSRMTIDIDLALALDETNVRAALQALEGLGLRPRLPVPSAAFADEDTRRGWVEERHLVAFTMHDPDDARREVDLLAEPGLPAQELLDRAVVMTVSGTPVRVVSLPDLVAMKERVGRPQDLADVDALRRLHPDL